jgi:alpha-N-arabinofuranosidase
VRAREGYHYRISIRKISGKLCAELIATVQGEPRTIGRTKISRGPIVLEVRAEPSTYTFRVSSRGRWHELGRLPTRPLSSEYITDRGPMHFTGAMIGLYASGNGRRSRGAADFDWFEYLPLP